MRRAPSRPFGLPLPAVLLLLALPLLGSLRYWFVCDDAFITFRYVRNLLRGEGLVWNPGEYVEGYTNFLWALELAATWALGWRPESASAWLGLAWTVVLGLALAALAARATDNDDDRPWVVAIALLLWGTNRSVMVWATSGLEMRQFSALCTLGLLWAWSDREHRGSLAASTAYGLAALTRPEALLFGPVVMAVWAWRAWRQDALRPGPALRLGLPFALLVGGHLLWRVATYGEWLPNTYYAKNVRDWWEAGAGFLAYITLEHALYLTVPLAIVGGRAAWRRGGELPLFALAWVLPYLLHLAKIGGDHFEFRMFDVIWPVLYVFSAQGIVTLAGRAREAWRARARVGLALAAVVYGAALPLAHDARALTIDRMIYRMHLDLSTTDAPWLWAVPGVPLLLPAYNPLGAWLADHAVAARARTHHNFAEMMLRRYGAFREFEDETLFSEDAVTKASSIGVIGFYLDDIVLIDILGLTDHTVARTPTDKSNASRRMGHDRRPPPGYLDARGYNLDVLPVRDSKEAALAVAPFAFELTEGVWVPVKGHPPSRTPFLIVGRDAVQR